MKETIIFMAVLFGCAAGVSAQKSKDLKPKDLKIALESVDVVIEQLKNDSANLSEKKIETTNLLDAALKRNSSFVPGNGEEGVKRLLNGYNLNDLLASQEVITKLEKHKNYALSAAYLEVFAMNRSLLKEESGGGYNKVKNEQYIKELESVRNTLLEQHRNDFDKLASKIEDYSFTIRELIRVLNLVDSQKDDADIEKLEKDAELEYIKGVEYANDIVQRYIISSNKIRKEMKKRLSDNCGVTIN